MKRLIIYLILLSQISFAKQPVSTLSTKIIEKLGNIYSQIEETLEKPVFVSQPIPDYIYEKMLGKSIPQESKDDVDISKLSYLQISYYGFDGKTHVGEMIVNAKVANDVLETFKEIYNIKYPIEKMRLIDEYDANDEASMTDNNTSCFCYRVIARNNKYLKPCEAEQQ